MKKRLLSIFCVLALCLGLLPVTALAIDQAPTGSGTEESPYQIGTADELRWLAEYVNGNDYDPEETFLYVELTADIDLNPGYTFAADGTFTGGESPVEWAPIGLITTDLNTQKPFYGSFDGKGHTIYGLYTAAGDSDSLGWGLFSYAVGYITDLHLENSYIGSVSACTGSIAGILGGTIEGCSSAAYLSCGGSWEALNGHGGIVGNLNDVGSEALSCTFSGVLRQTSGSPYVGGVVGSNDCGYVADCVNQGSVTAENADKVGGIVGNNSIAYDSQSPISGETSVIERCVNYGAVTSTYPNTTDNVGGIVGMSSWGDGSYVGAVRDCLNLGTVTGVTYVGGIAGYLEEDTPLENCYNAGSVTGGTNAAGLVGKQSKGCPITNSYYLKTDTLNSGLQAVGALGTGNYVPEEEEQVNYTACVTAEAAASGQLAWTLQKGRETLVWGQALTGQTPDETPGLTAEQEKRVMQVKFLSADDTTASELATRYTNAGTVLADYPSPSGGDERYIFYTDRGCTQAIAPDTHTFAADATLYVKTTTPTQVTITGVTAQGDTYNGQPQQGYTGTPSAEGYGGGFTVTYNTADGEAPTNAGAYIVTIAIPEDNAQYVGSADLQFTIAPKALTVSAPSPSVYVGDSAPELALAYTGLVAGESVTPSEDPVFTITKADGTVIALEDAVKTAGTYTITWSNADQGFTGDENYDIQTETAGTLTVSTRSSGGGSSSNITTETTKNPDGSTTITVTNKVTGTVTETTTWPDGSKEVIETKKDGTVTTTTTDTAGNQTAVVEKPDGSSQTTVNNKDGSGSVTLVDADGNIISQTTLSEAAIAAAQAAGEAVTLPMPEVPITTDRETAPTVTVDLPSGTSAKVEIPVADVTPGTVAILVNDDGTEEVIKTSLTTENGVAVTLSDGDTVKVVDNSKTFDDVADNYWGAEAVDFAVSRELFAGTSATTFAPDTAMTRAMIVTVLARFEGVDTTTGSTWYEAGQQWAMENGVSDGTNMDASLTREQLATMLYRYAQSKGYDTTQGGMAIREYADFEQISDYAVEAMTWAVNTGLISGTSTTTLSPQGLATRAQVATILMRFIEGMA